MTPLPQALTLLPSTLLMVLQMMKQKGLQEAWQEAVCVCLYVCVFVCYGPLTCEQGPKRISGGLMELGQQADPARRPLSLP